MMGEGRTRARGLGAFMLASAGLASTTLTAVLAAQQTPPDVVVQGGTPRMIAGLWSFRSSIGYTPPPGNRRMRPPRLARSWNLCVTDGDTRAILEQLVGERAGFDGGQTCSSLSLSIERDRVHGSRRCMVALGAVGSGIRTTRFRSRIGERKLAADYALQGSIRGETGPSTRWQVTADRVGDCPAAGKVLSAPALAPAPTPVVVTAPLIRAVSGRAEEPVSPGPMSDAADHPVAVAGVSPRPAPPPAGEADDVVVIARKLRVMRLHYASDGALFRWCHADISSGDPRIDRIGCALVRACVREGSDTVADTLACYHRKVDTLDPVTGAARRPVAAPAK